MAENEDGQEKKHDPGAKQWADAAERGQIVKSSDLSSAVVLLSAVAGMTLGGEMMALPIQRICLRYFDVSKTVPLTQQIFMGSLQEAMIAIASAVMVPLGMVVVGAIAINLMQTQGQLATKALEPKPDRLNALTGFKNQYMSMTPVVELIKGVGKIGALSLVMYITMQEEVKGLPGLAYVATGAYLQTMQDIGWMMILVSMPLILVLSAVDYAYSWYQLNEQLMQTDKEVKDERKSNDGDPLVKAQRMALARRMLASGGLKNVPTADVVITNPTHYSVALRYDRARDVAPIVVAKGVDHMAKKIREMAKENGIPVIEDVPLARALFAEVQVEHPIPEERYGAVARVLAIVWKRKRPRR
ncbi:MAG: flagellar type III secretion system protein FlhB [Rhodobacterales bacterium]|nr:flagellar type III secretion system protein FlhB [Rhodobacterales bacterium]